MQAELDQLRESNETLKRLLSEREAELARRDAERETKIAQRDEQLAVVRGELLVAATTFSLTRTLMNLLRPPIAGAPGSTPRQHWAIWPEGHKRGPLHSEPWTARSQQRRGFPGFDTRYRRLQGCVSASGPAGAGWNASFGFSKGLMGEAV